MVQTVYASCTSAYQEHIWSNIFLYTLSFIGIVFLGYHKWNRKINSLSLKMKIVGGIILVLLFYSSQLFVAKLILLKPCFAGVLAC